MSKSLFATMNALPEDEMQLIRKIAKRAYEVMSKDKGFTLHFDATDLTMDITACHAIGCPLRLRDLLQADDFNLLHDVCGIRNNINRKTGKLRRFFLPRFAQPQPRKQDA